MSNGSRNSMTPTDALMRSIGDLEGQLNAARIRIKDLHILLSSHTQALQDIEQTINNGDISQLDIQAVISKYGLDKARK